MIGIILASGFGTRLRPLTDKIPKPAIEVGGKPAIRRIVDHLRESDIRKIFVNVYHLSYQVIECINKYPNLHIYQEKEIEGTAGVLRHFKDFIYEDFLVQNGDTLTNLDILDMYAYHKRNRNIATIFTQDSAIHCGGTYIFKPKIFDFIPVGKYMIDTQLVPYLQEQKIPISLYRSNAWYRDIGTPDKLKEANDYYRQQRN